MGERRCARRILVGKPEGKRQLRRPRRRWGNNIKMDLQELGIDFYNSGEGQRERALVKAVTKFGVHNMRGNS
jgi:hypothetical protein